MRPRHANAGFTLVEVMVAAVMIATVLLGMGAVMMNYTTARNKISGLAVAQNIVQAEIDDVLMHTQIENSLVSDTQGRARPVYLENGTGSVLVSNYWYLNFPVFPENTTHNSPGMTWGKTLDELYSRFTTPPGRLYNAGGGLEAGVDDLNADDANVAYIARLQLFGAMGPVPNIEEYVNGKIDATYPHGKYADSIARPDYLIADTCTNENGAAIDNSDSDPNFNKYRVKILVVRVYDKKQVFDENGSMASFMKKGGGAKPEITHSYAVLNGKIRL